MLQTLLASHSPLTLGATLNAFLEICPDQLELLHPYYRHICRLLVDADEWGQVVALQVLTRYARTMLERPESAGSAPPQATPIKADSQGKDDESEDEYAGIEMDLAMLLHCSRPLLQSRNPAVVLEAAVMYYHLAPAGHKSIGQEILVPPLLKLATIGGAQIERSETALMAWQVIGAIVEERPVSRIMRLACRVTDLLQWLFSGRFSSFLLHSSESSSIQIAKLRALSALVTPSNVKSFLRECKVSKRFSGSVFADALHLALCPPSRRYCRRRNYPRHWAGHPNSARCQKVRIEHPDEAAEIATRSAVHFIVCCQLTHLRCASCSSCHRAQIRHFISPHFFHLLKRC